MILIMMAAEKWDINVVGVNVIGRGEAKWKSEDENGVSPSDPND